MGTVYMVFHSVLQFWPGSAEAVSATTTGVVMSAAPIPAAARIFFMTSYHCDDLPVGEVFSVGAFRVMPIGRQNEMLFALPIPIAAVDCEPVGHGGFPFRGLAGRISAGMSRTSP